ncbi:DUF58 domain-containing protein [Georgenia yuyongxinii]
MARHDAFSSGPLPPPARSRGRPARSHDGAGTAAPSRRRARRAGRAGRRAHRTADRPAPDHPRPGVHRGRRLRRRRGPGRRRPGHDPHRPAAPPPARPAGAHGPSPAAPDRPARRVRAAPRARGDRPGAAPARQRRAPDRATRGRRRASLPRPRRPAPAGPARDRAGGVDLVHVRGARHGARPAPPRPAHAAAVGPVRADPHRGRGAPGHRHRGPAEEPLPGDIRLPGAGARSRPAPTGGEDDVATRPFRDGDDLRRVHWPASAHHGRLVVRQEDRPVGLRAHLFLDARWSAHRGTGPSSSFEWAVTALASVATALAARGCELRLVTAETVRDGAAARPLRLATVLRYLAVADLVHDDLGQLLHALGRPGADMTVAVVPDRDVPLLLAAAGAHPSAGTRVLVVLRRGTFGGGRTVQALPRTPGWRCVEVRAGTGVREAWGRAAVAAPVLAGRSRP